MKASKTVLARVLFVVLATALYYPVNAQLKANFTSTTQRGCVPLVVSFKDSSSGSPSAWFWDLGNGVTSTEKNPVTYYFDPGTYSIKLIVRKNGMKADTVVKTSYIIVYQAPMASFTLSDSIGCAPLVVNYTNTSKAGSGEIVNSQWDFGDGSNSNAFAPSHSYASAGTFSAVLSVINSYGCTNTVDIKKNIDVRPRVTAGFSFDNTSLCKSPGQVFFSADSTNSGSNFVGEWSWGDGSPTALGTTISHNYIKAGDYRVVLKVTSQGVCADTVSKAVHVAFIKSAISIGDTICANNSLQFVNASTPTPANAYWDFGDSTNSSSLSPIKKYGQSGNFTVTLVNNFFAGCSDTLLKIVHIKTPPQASFVVTDSAACFVPFTGRFGNTSSGAGLLRYIWDFGDGNTATTANTTHQYTQQGAYTVTLKAFTSNGCASIFAKLNAVVIKPVQITGVTGFGQSKCVPATVHAGLLTNLPVNIAKYSWDFGDGYVSADASPAHTFTAAGIYIVKVSIETVTGCTAFYTFTDSIGQKLHPSFTVTPAAACASTEIAFNNTTATGSTFLWWYTGDGDTIYNQPNPSHNYQDTGWFSPMLVVMQYGCYDTLIKKDSVHIVGPIARFVAKNNCINKRSVTFVNSSIEDFTRTWAFGDGTTDTLANPIHLYSVAGVYKASLLVSNRQCNFKLEQVVEVVDEKGKLNIVDSILCRNTSLKLSVGGVNNSNIDTTWWSMGNGTILSEAQNSTANYTYATNGKFAVYAVVKDILGCRDTLRQPYQLSVYGPHAKFAEEKTGACRNTSVTFTDASTSDGLHTITNWLFNFGDSSVVNYLTPRQVSHTYKINGLFTTLLTVTDNIGCTDSVLAAKPILITQPAASLKISDSLVCPGKQVAFTNTSVGNMLTLVWDFGDNTQAIGSSAAHSYSAQGAYYAKLYVTDINKCKDTATSASPIRVAKPSAVFAISDSFTTCPPLNVGFLNQSTNYINMQWVFGDSNTSTIPSPQHVYTTPGVYAAKLLLTGNGGCADTAVKTITIKGPTGKLIYNSTPACYPFAQKINASSITAVQYLWDYSDGTTSTTSIDSTSHLYQPGFYVPRLILIDEQGCKVPVKGVDTVRVYGVKALAKLDNHLICDSGVINFQDSSITNDAVKLSQWAFGDNSFALGRTTRHTYNMAGTYYARLVTITNNGCTDTLNIPAPVKVAVTPVVAIKGGTTFCAPANVQMGAGIEKAGSDTLNWKWDFGNGDTALGQYPAAELYTQAGNYNVLVTAGSASGCKGAAATTITLHAPPAVKTGNDTSICRSSAIRLNATGAASYIWDASASLSCTKCTSPLAIADSTTLYTVEGTDQFGCVGKDSMLVTVTQPVKISVSGNDTLCNGNSKKLLATGAQTYKWLPAIYLSDATAAQPTFFASKDTAITYKVIGYANNNCFTDSATIKVKVYPVPEMQVAEKAIAASAGSVVQLGTINSKDVTRWKWTPAMWLDNPNTANPVAQPRESITYTVVAANDGACVTRAQVAVTVICSGTNVYVPNTFSPNGDGVNDIFYARGTGIYNIKSFRIFNRWGQLVFERLNAGSNSPGDGWNGMINGSNAPADVYVYVIEVLCINNTIVPIKGNVTLLR